MYVLVHVGINGLNFNLATEKTSGWIRLCLSKASINCKEARLLGVIIGDYAEN